MKTSSRGKPLKTCKECGERIHARKSKCSCGYVFYMPKKEKRLIDAKNWRELKSGDVIKCVTGSGPYYLSSDRPLNPDGSRQKIMMGHKGKFEVSEIYDRNSKNCGIIAHRLYGRGLREGVREYIYMGEPFFADNISVHNYPHKIVVIKKND